MRRRAARLVALMPKSVLAGRGSLRRAKHRRTLSARFRPKTRLRRVASIRWPGRVNPFRAASFAFFPGFLGIRSEAVKAAPKARSYQP
jgi:hypothetical protein